MKYKCLCEHCNKIMFLVDKLPKEGDKQKPENLYFINIKRPKEGSYMKCQFCKKAIDPKINHFKKI